MAISKFFIFSYYNHGPVRHTVRIREGPQSSEGRNKNGVGLSLARPDTYHIKGVKEVKQVAHFSYLEWDPAKMLVDPHFRELYDQTEEDKNYDN